jgi:hypothetical protein
MKLPECKHADLEFVGEKKTDEGVNSYFRCRACKAVMVVTPERKAFTLKGRSELPD